MPTRKPPLKPVLAFSRPAPSVVDGLPANVYDLEWPQLVERFYHEASDQCFETVEKLMRAFFARECQRTVKLCKRERNDRGEWNDTDDVFITTPVFKKWTAATVDSVLARAVRELPADGGAPRIYALADDPNGVLIRNERVGLTLFGFYLRDFEDELKPAVQRYLNNVVRRHHERSSRQLMSVKGQLTAIGGAR